MWTGGVKKISIPLSLINTCQMNLNSAGSISQDSTFKICFGWELMYIVLCFAFGTSCFFNLNVEKKKIWNFLGIVDLTLILPTLLKDLTQDSATLTGWRRTKRSGEGKRITLYCPGIYCLRYWFPWSTEVFRNFRRFFLRKKRERAQGRIELTISCIPILSSTTRLRLPGIL